MPFLRLAFAGLLAAAPVQAAEVTVFAAASLKTALDEIAAEWTAATGTGVVVSYGGTPALAKQIAEGAPADVFLSASTQCMDDLEDQALIKPDTRRVDMGEARRVAGELVKVHRDGVIRGADDSEAITAPAPSR